MITINLSDKTTGVNIRINKNKYYIYYLILYINLSFFFNKNKQMLNIKFEIIMKLFNGKKNLRSNLKNL